MNKYKEMQERHQKEVNDFPMMFAFSDSQFKEGMVSVLGLNPEDTDKIVSIGYGGYIRKSDVSAMKDMNKRHAKELQEAIEGDKDGSGFIKDMFKYELANHEFCITGEYDDTLEAIGLTVDDVLDSEKLKRGLALAEKEYMKECY